MKKILLLVIGTFLLFIPKEVYALNEVNIYFFYSDTCNICEQEKVYLQALQKDRYPNIRIYSYEVTNDSVNYNLMQTAKELYNSKLGNGVPYTVIGDTAIAGFSQGVKGKFQNLVYQYSTKKYKNELGNKIGITYRTDLEGTVKEYKDKADYVVEESSGNQRTPSTNNNEDRRKLPSIILVTSGVILLLIYIVLYIKENRRG